MEIKGRGVGGGVVTGTLHFISDAREARGVREDEILFTEMTTPDMLIAMQRCKGWVTQRGGITCHAAIIAREMKKPCVVGLGENFSQLKNGAVVTIDGKTGIVVIE